MSQHFTGETVVSRGPWQMKIPLDFHIVFNPDEDERYREQAAMCIASFLSEEYVLAKEAEAEAAGLYNEVDED